MTWLDGIAFVLLLSFTIRGILRGTVAQVFALLGLLAGIWAGAQLAARMGDHWRDAHPAFVFAILRYVVAGLGGMAVATLIGWWGETIAHAVREGPLGGIDRMLGGVFGLLVGGGLAAIVVLVVLQAPGFGFARPVAERSIVGRPLVTAGARATSWREAPVPGATWLHRQFVAAEQRLSSSRSS